MKNHRNKFMILLSLLLVLMLALAACGGSEPATEEAPTAEPAPVEEPVAEEPVAEEEPAEEPAAEESSDMMSDVSCAEPVKVGLISDETGALAIYGAHILRAFPLGLEYATGAEGTDNGDYTSYMLGECEIQVYVRDDQSTPENTATVARELIEDVGVQVLVGTVSSGATATLQELARENQIPLIVAPAAANDITGVNFNEYTFRTSRNNYQDAVNLCEYLVTQYDTFVQIAPDYSFGYGGAQAFRDACTLFGGEFVADDIFAPADTTEFTPYMEEILNSGADAFLVTWAGGGFVPMMQAATDLGVFDEMSMGASFVDNVVLPAFFSNNIGNTSGILYHYTAPDNPINDWLVEQTMSRFSVPPDLFDADGMNAALLLTEALKATGGDASAEAMIDAMEGMEFEGPKGTINIRPEDHVAIQDMYIVKLTNLDDPEFKFFELVDTTRPNVPCLLPEALQDRCGDLSVGALGDISQTQVPEPAEEEMADMGTAVCEEPVKVGLITDMTGALSIYGAHVLRSFPYGLEYLSGAPAEQVSDTQWNFQVDDCTVEVYVKDDQSNPENTATVARELIEVEGVNVLVGTVSSGATATLQELARENQIPLIVAPAAANDITGVNFNEYTFRTSRNNYQDAVNLCEYLVKDYDTFVQIAPDYAFGYGGAAAFRDACTLFGGEFVADDIFAPADTTEFTPYMEQILDSGADAFLVTWAGGGFVPMMQAATDLGVFDEMSMGSSFVDNVVMPTFFSNAIGNTSGILYHYTAPDNEINDWLVAKTMENDGVPPDLFDADAMNAALLLGNALRATGGDTSADALIAAMEGMEFEGPKGTIYIRPEDHVAMQDMYIVTLTNVDDPEFKFFDYVETTRPDVPCLLPEALQDRCGDLPVGSLSGE
ncbi:MAG: substrate-binding domain-containing protein [Anaerolineae bacterium]|nr:substrate-binding domain-containing protein [Anaerolineae bacterium]